MKNEGAAEAAERMREAAQKLREAARDSYGSSFHVRAAELESLARRTSLR